MNTILNIQPNQIKEICKSIKGNIKEGKKSIILEPLQTLVQLALVSFCPIGTKLTIHNHVLLLQEPGITQPFNRWFNSDKKDDVYHLFPVIKRFVKWYSNNKKTIISKALYELLITLAQNGIDKLIKTYQTNETMPIIQVLNMYKDILNGNDTKPIETSPLLNKNIDEIFINISNIYDKHTILIIYNTFELLKNEKDPNAINNYISGLNTILLNVNTKITNWINENLII